MQVVFHKTLRRPAGRGAPPRSGLVNRPDEGAYNQIQTQAKQLLCVPYAHVILEGEDRCVFKPRSKTPDPWGWDGQTPRRHSFCHRIAAAGHLVAVGDARQHSLIQQNDAVLDAGVVAIASVPLVTREGFVIGALAVMDTKPRVWSALDLRLLSDLADSLMVDIEARRSCEQQYRMRTTRFDAELRCA